MRTINTTFKTFGASVLLLGLKGDSNATEILIDCAASLEEYQGTMAAMSITGPDDTVYPGDISLDENGIVHWVVAARDCGIAGNGSARVDLVDDEGTVVASAEARTIIMKTNMQGVAPDQIANWTEAASVALQEARAALLDLIDTDTTATTNEAARQLAETGRVSAETLRASAETARASAENARIAAENTRASAENARIAAETARVSEFSTIEANAQAALSYIGPSEASSTASAAHAAGSYFIYNGKLYQATADIAIGDTITSGTNCAQVPGGSMGEISNLKSATNDTGNALLGFIGTLSRTDVAVSKGSIRKELLTFDLTSGNSITIDIKLHSALSVNTYLYLQTENGTDLFPGTSRSIPSGSTTFIYSYTPSADNKNCKLQYTIASSAKTDALFDYVKITVQDSTYAADLANVYTTIIDSVAQNSYILQPKTGIVSVASAIVKKGTSQAVLLHCDLQSGNPITIRIKLKSALSINTYMYLQDANGTNLLPSTSYSLSSGNTEYVFTFTPSQDYTNCSLKYTIGNTATTDAYFEYISIKMAIIDNDALEIIAYNSTLVSESVIQNEYTYPIFYKADSINFKTSSNAFSGVQFMITDNIAIGETIKLKGQRGESGNGWALRIDFRDSDNQRIGSEHRTTGNEVSEVIPEGTAKIDFTLAGCWGTAIGENTSITFTDVGIYYSAIEDLQDDETGTNEYTGQKIVLTDNPTQKNKCDITLWKNFLGTDIPNLADYNLYRNQSLTIYGGYVFLFQEQGTALILDYETKAILSEAEVPPTRGQHHNSAQFTNLYYDSGDEFPLLITARCGNANQGASDGDECQIYRVTRSNTTFTFTLINRIFCDITTKGASWGIDNTTKQLYLFGAQTAWWESGTHLPIVLAVWDMPTLTQIKSGTDIMLHKADCVAFTTLPDMTIQGMAVYGGIAYIGISAGIQYVYAIDVFANRILSKVPLTQNIEVEGVAVYDSKIYVSQKRGADTAGTNPCEIYEIDF